MPETFRNLFCQVFILTPQSVGWVEDYYLVNSTFEYFPGLSIFHSRDLSIGKRTFPPLFWEGRVRVTVNLLLSTPSCEGRAGKAQTLYTLIKDFL